MAARSVPRQVLQAKVTTRLPISRRPATFHTLFSHPRAKFHLYQLNSHLHTSLTRTMPEHASTYRANGDNGDDGSTEGELNEWKHRAPYRVHDNDPNFHVRYSGSCHCGRVQYQLSREKPLDAKYCHCTTCQKIHGMVHVSHAPPKPAPEITHSPSPAFS